MSEWISVEQAMPAAGVEVRIHGLFSEFTAFHSGQRWMAIDRHGNKTPLMWSPEYWFPVVRLEEPNLPTKAKGGE